MNDELTTLDKLLTQITRGTTSYVFIKRILEIDEADAIQEIKEFVRNNDVRTVDAFEDILSEAEKALQRIGRDDLVAKINRLTHDRLGFGGGFVQGAGWLFRNMTSAVRDKEEYGS